jgi:hypothetical protein
MKHIVSLLFGIVLLFQSGCVSTTPFTPQKHAKLKLILLFEDRVTIESNQSIIISLKDRITLPQIGAAVNKEIEASFRRAGFEVTRAELTPEIFWSKFDEAAKTKEGSGWHLGVTQNLKVTLKSLIETGLLKVSPDEMILVLGPSQMHYDALFMSRDGNGVTLSKGPVEKMSASLFSAIDVFDPKTFNVTGYSFSAIFSQIDLSKNALDFKKLSVDDEKLLTDLIVRFVRSNAADISGSLKYIETSTESSK